MKLSKDSVLQVLTQVFDPRSEKNLVELGLVEDVEVQASRVTFTLYLAGLNDEAAEKVKSDAITVVKEIGATAVFPNVVRKMKEPQRRQSSQVSQAGIPGVKKVIVVGSGKGGVGKSTTSVNLAFALKELGYSVGLLDADIYGPSVPGMLAKEFERSGKSKQQPEMVNEQFIPFDMYGLQVMSLGLLIDENQPTVWRAPIATKMINQFIKGVRWENLDFLIVDLPPGTGDIQLTLSQQANIAGAIIVSTPQRVALDIARKGLLMFKHVGVPILGVVETMSGFACGQCGGVTNIFGEGGAKKLAEVEGIPMLGQIPMDVGLVQACDEGEPIVEKNAEAPSAKAFLNTAQNVVEELKKQSSSDEEIVPLAVEGLEREGGFYDVAVYWSDKKKYIYPARALRGHCPCASCVDEFTGERKFHTEDASKEIRLDKALPVGRYGVNFVWSDGHSTGIYTYEYLRALDSIAKISTEELPQEAVQQASV